VAAIATRCMRLAAAAPSKAFSPSFSKVNTGSASSSDASKKSKVPSFSSKNDESASHSNGGHARHCQHETSFRSQVAPFKKESLFFTLQVRLSHNHGTFVNTRAHTLAPTHPHTHTHTSLRPRRSFANTLAHTLAPTHSTTQLTPHTNFVITAGQDAHLARQAVAAAPQCTRPRSRQCAVSPLCDARNAFLAR
jgi:hypothetical protein